MMGANRLRLDSPGNDDRSDADEDEATKLDESAEDEEDNPSSPGDM